jgi:hypothetical protein
VGLPVAKARAARESMMRLTQRSWIAFNGDCFMMQEPTKVTVRATKLTLN